MAGLNTPARQGKPINMTRDARLLSIPTHLQPERIPDAAVFHLLHQYRVNK
jgi:hypothetical protein